MDHNQPPASTAERRDRKTPPAAPAVHRSRKPALLGAAVAAGAVGAWLLRRERIRPPEGIWRDVLTSDTPGPAGASGTPGASGTRETDR